MEFIEAIEILNQGFPLKHPIHGRLYKVPEKETFCLHLSPNTYRKVVCTDLELFVLLPVNSEQYELITDISHFEHSNDWSILWN